MRNNPLYNAFSFYKTNRDNLGRTFSKGYAQEGEDISPRWEFQTSGPKKTPNIIKDIVGNWNESLTPGSQFEISPDRLIGTLSGLGINKEHFAFRVPSTAYDILTEKMSPEEQRELYGTQMGYLSNRYGNTLPQFLHRPSRDDVKEMQPFTAEYWKQKVPEQQSIGLNYQIQQHFQTADRQVIESIKQYRRGDEERATNILNKAFDTMESDIMQMQLRDENGDFIMTESDAVTRVRSFQKKLEERFEKQAGGYDGDQWRIWSMRSSNSAQASLELYNHVNYWQDVVDGKEKPSHTKFIYDDNGNYISHKNLTKEQIKEKNRQVKTFLYKDIFSGLDGNQVANQLELPPIVSKFLGHEAYDKDERTDHPDYSDQFRLYLELDKNKEKRKKDKNKIK